jgi:hypothetical protein
MVRGVVGYVKPCGLSLPRSAIIQVTDVIPPIASACNQPSESGSFSFEVIHDPFGVKDEWLSAVLCIDFGPWILHNAAIRVQDPFDGVTQDWNDQG